MRNLIFIVFSICFINIPILAQQELSSQLEGMENLEDIMEVVDAYYKGHEDNWKGVKGKDPKLKHWKRWQWYMSGRLGTKNEFVSIHDSLNKAMKMVDKSFPSDTWRTVNSAWESVGPSSTTSGIGRADRIAFHPSNPNVFYVGTPAAGLWRTTNGGTTWTSLMDHMPAIGISGVVVDWNTPSTIYVLTGDGDSANIGGFVAQFGYGRKSIGVWKSTDSGNTWKPTGILDPGDYQSFRLVQSPISPNTLLVATNIGLFRTTNGGGSWQKTLNDDIYDIEFKPGNGVVYASSNDKIYYSLFSGSSWTEASLDVSLGSPSRIELAVTPADNSYVYALIGEVNTAGTYGGTYRSTDNGMSYNLRGTTPNILGSASDGSDNSDISEYAHAMAVSNTNKNTLVTGGIRIWKSTNGGSTYPTQKSGYHSDIHELAYNPLNDKLYACTDGGIYISEDDGESWTSFFEGFITSQIYHMAGTVLDDDHFIIGLQDNGVKLKSDATTTWDHVNGADGFDVSFNPVDETEFYATVNQGAIRFWNSGTNSTSITAPNSDWFGTIRAHVSDENTVFYGSDTFQISNDKGLNWTPVLNSATWALETCPSNSNRLYAAGASTFNVSSNGTLSRSDDQGVTWTQLQTNTGFPTNTLFNKITDIAVNPGNSNSVYGQSNFGMSV